MGGEKSGRCWGWPGWYCQRYLCITFGSCTFMTWTREWRWWLGRVQLTLVFVSLFFSSPFFFPSTYSDSILILDSRCVCVRVWSLLSSMYRWWEMETLVIDRTILVCGSLTLLDRARWRNTSTRSVYPELRGGLLLRGIHLRTPKSMTYLKLRSNGAYPQH